VPNSRNIVFANNEVYHVFNRGIDKRLTFINKRGYNYALEGMRFYQFDNKHLRLSKYLALPLNKRMQFLSQLYLNYKRRVQVLAFCLMPNHFHFLLRQKMDHGVSLFAADFTNSYTKYFNSKNKRVGPLFQGLFKAVHIESDEELIHVSRYIHLNPVTAYLMDIEDLKGNIYSSYREYIDQVAYSISLPEVVLGLFANRKAYIKFVENQVDYARALDKIKHLTFDNS
jgi:putative transposase